MAELVVFNLASKVLSVIASPVLQKAYAKGLSIWEAKDELDKLRVTIETIVAVLLDAEKKQEGSAAVRNWIMRLKGVLYDAEDLFDEVATEELLKQQIMKKGNNMLSKKVQVYSSKLNPIISRNSIANKVKSIRKRLIEISSDMAGLGFVRCDSLEENIPTGLRRGQDPGLFVDSKGVIGRDNDKKAILELLLHDESYCSKKDAPFVIAIVGIAGMGKTTLAQLIYNDVEVKKKFFGNMWFSCISDVSDDIEVLGKIFQSICGQHYSGFTVGQLQTKIRKSTEGNKFLLVLDDVWDENHARWLDRMGLLGGGAIGSRIIVTTRSPFVATAVGALETHNLDGLSEDDSWDLFKMVAFVPGNENDPRRIDLGKEIVKKCKNVPLAIKSIASLLFEKNTIQEWEFIRNEELSKLGQSHEDGIMPVLKLSYDHLPSYLKQCFASCSLFPKDYILRKMDLMYLWIAQGYIKSDNEKQTLEDVSHSCFMYLLRRGFFHEVYINKYDEIEVCKMHDLLVDLARHVAGEESIVLTTPSMGTSICPRHVSVEYPIDDSWTIPAPLLNVDGIRSFMFMHGGSIYGATLDQLYANYKLLRNLNLSRMRIEEVPSCIGELKHLRIIDLSNNRFERLPNSMMNLVNLLSLVLENCPWLNALPDSFRKLINLRHLNIKRCERLTYMPYGIGELTCLQYLSSFKVGEEREGVQVSGLDALVGLRLRGELVINFEDDIDNWDDDQCVGWQLPESLQVLFVLRYPGIRMPHWVNGRATNVLTSLYLDRCSRVKYLSPLLCLPRLKYLKIFIMMELEYVEEEEEEEEEESSNVASVFFPRLEKLELYDLPKLMGWRRKPLENPPVLFSSLYELTISGCSKLKSIPLCPHLRKLRLREVGCDLLRHFLLVEFNPSSSSLEYISIKGCKGLTNFSDESFTSLREVHIFRCNDLKIMELRSPHLKELKISSCDEILRFEVDRLESLKLYYCNQLMDLHIAQPNFLKDMRIFRCPNLELWEEGKRDANWDSLSNLSLLAADSVPPQEMLPNGLRQRQALGKLQIVEDVSCFPMDEYTISNSKRVIYCVNIVSHDIAISEDP